MSELPPPPDNKHSVLLCAGNYEDRVVVDRQAAIQLVAYSEVMGAHVRNSLQRTAHRALGIGAASGAALTVVAYLLGQLIF